MSTIFKNNRFFPQNFLLLSDSGIGLDNQITEICQEAFRVSPGSFNGEANKPFFPNKKPHAEVPAARKRTTCKNKKRQTSQYFVENTDQDIQTISRDCDREYCAIIKMV